MTIYNQTVFNINLTILVSIIPYCMPELPDVETFKRYIDSTALHKKINSVDIPTPKILYKTTTQTITKNLLHKTFTETHRHGKYLFLQLSNHDFLLLHFGMTGEVKYFQNKNDQPPHTRFLVEFKNGYYLAFDNQRILGKVGYIEDIASFLEEKSLGEDALEIDEHTFLTLLSKRRGSVKSALMNQKILAGIGNIYADEILFQTRLFPKKSVNDLSKRQLKTLFKNVNKVLTTAIDAQAHPQDFPKNFIIPHRKKEGNCPIDHTPLKTLKVNGRTTYYCPKHQKK